MDSVLMALFYPRGHRDFYMSHILELQPRQADVQPDAWEARITESWRRNVLLSLRKDIERLVATPPPSEGWPLDAFRFLISAAPYSSPVQGETINFGHAGQQSAVDFLRFLFALCETRDSFVTFQTSATLFERRPEIDTALQTTDPILTLMHMWTDAPKTGEWTRETVASLPDEDERASLSNDRSGASSFTMSVHGDRRRISGVQSMSLILCPLTAEDTHAHIVRDIVPRLDLPGEGYTGSVGVTMSALRLIFAPVLIFEVTRRVYTAGGEGVKSVAQVNYGEVQCNGEVHLTLQNEEYALQAVVCHFGSSVSGHYIAFVQHSPGEWFLYDDALSPQLRRVDDGVAGMEAMGSPSRSGELFFYVPCAP